MSSKGYIKRGQLRIQKKLDTIQLIFEDMREEYDFSKGKRGIYSRDLKDLHLPVYLDLQLEEYYKKIALKKKKDLRPLLIRFYKKK